MKEKNYEPRLTGGHGKVTVDDKKRFSGTASIQWLVPGIKGDGKKSILELLQSIDMKKIKVLTGKGSSKIFSTVPGKGDLVEVGVTIHGHYVEGIKADPPVENKDKGGGLFGLFKRNRTTE